ncbi:MAG: hypothetical protein R3A46_18625 [Thermomicrobiales bacterium]
MFHRISASVIVPDGDRILMVKSFESEDRPGVGGMTGYYWNFPTGAGQRRVGARRGGPGETREETGWRSPPNASFTSTRSSTGSAPPGATEQRVRQVDFTALASSYAGEIRTADPPPSSMSVSFRG